MSRSNWAKPTPPEIPVPFPHRTWSYSSRTLRRSLSPVQHKLIAADRLEAFPEGYDTKELERFMSKKKTYPQKPAKSSKRKRESNPFNLSTAAPPPPPAAPPPPPASVPQQEPEPAGVFKKRSFRHEAVEGRARNPFASDEQIENEDDEDVSTITRELQLEYLSRLVETPESIADIRLFPQRSAPWKVARGGRVTGSVIGSATGENPFDGPDALLKEKLWRSFDGNEYTRHGTYTEPLVEQVYINASKTTHGDSTFKCEFPGLTVHPIWGMFAYSPDGVATQEGQRLLVEFKALVRDALYKPKIAGEANIPVYYRSQIQFGMWLLDLPCCDFTVYTKSSMRTERYARDDTYIEWMLGKIFPFYFNRYLPALVAKEQG